MSNRQPAAQKRKRSKNKQRTPNELKLGRGSIYIRNFPEAIKRQFKKLCIDEGTTLTKKIIAMMEQAIRSRAG